MDLNGLALVGEYDTALAARKAAALLGQHGIRAVLPRDPRDRNPKYGPVTSLRGKVDVMDLLVPEADADRARALLGNDEEIADGGPPPGFRDEDLPAWVEELDARQERNRYRSARSRRVWIPALGLVAAAMIVLALVNIVADLS
jgi:hypothetical protein